MSSSEVISGGFCSSSGKSINMSKILRYVSFSAPNQDKIVRTGAKAPVLFGKLWFCAAKPICFSGGRVAIQARGGVLFCVLKRG